MKRICRILLTLGVGCALLPAISLSAFGAGPVRIYPSPAGEPVSTNFTVSVARSNVPVYLATIATADPVRRLKIFATNDTSYADQTSFASFDMQGGAEVTVTCSQPIQSVRLSPVSSGLTPVVAGNRITFTITRPQPLALEVNGDWVHALQLFANPIETDVPRAGDTNVIYFGPGIHKVEDLRVTSGQTIYIAGGAVLYGQPRASSHASAVISLVGTNIILRGRGIIDGSLCPLHTRNLIYVNGTNVSLEGVILRESSTWNVPIRRSEQVTVDNVKIFGVRANSDGIDICNSRYVRVRNRYLRTMDDLVVVKTDSGQGKSHDIDVRQCVLWNELAHALSVGAELRENVDGVHFSDCDVIHDKGREWLLRVYHCDSAHIRDVTFDNIRIEESKRLMSLWIGKAIWSKESERGHIDDITFRNIRAVGPNPLIELNGFDAEHAIHNVLFDNIVVNGKPLAAPDVKQNEFVQGVSVKP